MTQLGVDSFIRPDQSGWGNASDGQTWAQLRGNGALAISSNKGTITRGGGAYEVMALGTGVSADGETSVRFITGSLSDSAGLTFRYTDSNNWYYFDLGNLGQKIEIGKDVAGTFTSLVSAAFTWTATTAYRMRARIVGSFLALKVWADGVAEPNTWGLSVADSSLTAPGRICISCLPGSGSTLQFDSFSCVDYIWADSTPLADSFGSQVIFNPVDQLSVLDSLSMLDTASFVDGLAISDSFSAQLSLPQIIPSNVILRARNGNVVERVRNGNVLLRTRNGTIILRGREP